MAAEITAKLTTNGLGGATTSTPVTLSPSLHNVFDILTLSECLSGDTEYRAIDLYNTGNATATFCAVYSTASTSTFTELEMGVEASPIGSTTAIADEGTPPAGVSFAVKSSSSKLSLPDIAAGSYVRLWLKRIVTAGAQNMSNDLSTITVEAA